VSTTVEAGETALVPFDFARPGRLTRERARLIQVALDEVAREATEALRLWVDGIAVEAGEVEERAVGDLINGVADHTAVFFPHRAERGLVITEMPLAVALVLTLLGGPPQDPNLDRPLTHLETEVLDLVLRPMLQCISTVLKLGPVEVEVHESDPTAVNFIDERELMLGIPFTLGNEDFSGRMWVVLTPGSFQPFTIELERRQAGRRSSLRPVDRDRNEAALQRVPVPVICGFPPVRVPARELATLQPGDVLRTGQPTTRDLVFTVGGSPMFGARAGQRGLRLVAEVISVLDPNARTSLGGTQ
jgi:flagellar motor switch protein FliM